MVLSFFAAKLQTNEPSLNDALREVCREQVPNTLSKVPPHHHIFEGEVLPDLQKETPGMTKETTETLRSAARSIVQTLRKLNPEASAEQLKEILDKASAKAAASLKVEASKRPLRLPRVRKAHREGRGQARMDT